MRDLFSAEIKRTLDPYGVYKKIPDRGYKRTSGAVNVLGNSDVEPGFPDGFFICEHGGCFIETKTGDGPNRSRFPFSDWRPNQRQWYFDVAVPKRIPFYLFIVLGDKVQSAEYGRISILLSASTFLEVEKASDRKSLSYDEAFDFVSRLDWAGKGTWSIPKDHEFYKRFKLGALSYESAIAGDKHLRLETGSEGNR